MNTSIPLVLFFWELYYYSLWIYFLGIFHWHSNSIDLKKKRVSFSWLSILICCLLFLLITFSWLWYLKIKALFSCTSQQISCQIPSIIQHKSLMIHLFHFTSSTSSSIKVLLFFIWVTISASELMPLHSITAFLNYTRHGCSQIAISKVLFYCVSSLLQSLQ